MADITDIQNFIELIKRGISPAVGEEMTSLAERLRSEGFDAGIQQGMQRGMQQGVEQGVEQEKRIIAIRLLQRGITLEEAKDITGLPLEILQKLQREIRH